MNIRRPAGALESEILAALTASDEPMTAADIRTSIDDALAYTTVMTVLSRLAKKGVVSEGWRGKRHVYEPIRDPAEITAWRMQRLLDAGHDRAAVLARFVGTLSYADERLLLGMLESSDRETR